MTNPNPPIGLDDPRVQARVDEKAKAHHAEVDARMRAAFAVPRKVGNWTFHPPNACLLDAICQPGILSLSQMRVRIILGYLMTVEPSRQIAEASNITTLRQSAAEWEDAISADILPSIVVIINEAHEWLQSRLMRDSTFFFGQHPTSPLE